MWEQHHPSSPFKMEDDDNDLLYNNKSLNCQKSRSHIKQTYNQNQDLIFQKSPSSSITNFYTNINNYHDTSDHDHGKIDDPSPNLNLTTKRRRRQRRFKSQSRVNIINLLHKASHHHHHKSISTLFLTILTIIIDILFFTLTITNIHCYNLDTQKALLKQGPEGSYFGYSIAQHVVYDASNLDSTYRSFVLVGAPKAEARLSLRHTVQRPGAVYKCDFDQSQSCHLLDVDPTSTLLGQLGSNAANSRTSNNNNNNIANNSTSVTGFILASNSDPIVQHDNQWLGVSVKSQGPNGYAMVCAHRQILKGPKFQWPQGICYSLTRNLTCHKPWQPCLNRPVNYGHEEYGFCQVGTSCDISDTSDIVLGSPGPRVWRGTIFSNSISFTPKDDRTWYMAPIQDNEAKVDYYSYLGMSIITGKFFNKQQHFISGAPRSKETGQVLIMTKHQSVNDYLAQQLSSSDNSNFKTIQIIDGDQVGASFGYTLAKLDFNGDGLLDLAVGAPFYFTKNEGGAVYFYTNNGKQFNPTPSVKLVGKARESRFGFALANCGDLNHDKYDDIAIGAPYEGPGGVVYIHLGSANGIKPSPSQVIRASSINTNLQTFGYSLSGGLDMDLNGYPDLVVGSYADDSVYILRARPIIQITTSIAGNLTRIDANRTTCDGERNQLPCFKFNTCFELDPSEIGQYTDSMKLKYRIEAETFTGKKFSRVKFHDSENSDAQHILEKEILIDNPYRGMKLKRCNTQRVLIRDRSDIHSPIQFKLTYSLVQPNNNQQNLASSQPSGSSSLSSTFSLTSRNRIVLSSSINSGPNQLSNSGSSTSSSSLSSTSSSCCSPSSSCSSLVDSSPPSAIAMPAPFPILNQEEAQRVFSARFLKDCGSNDICESHLNVEGDLAVPKESLWINEVGNVWDKQANVSIRVTNNNEPAYEAKLFINHPSSVTYSGTKILKAASFVECTPLPDMNQIRCDLGNPMPRGSTKLLMIFQTQGQAGTFDFQLMVNTTSQNSPDAKWQAELSKTVMKKAEIQYIPRQPPVITTDQQVTEPPIWLILLAILLGILMFGILFYCLHINGFFERRNKGVQYTQAETEDRFR